MSKPKPCIAMKKSWWDGLVVTYCGKRFKAFEASERWLNYNAFTRPDTCPACVQACDKG